MSVGSTNNNVALDSRIGNLSGNIFVTEPDHKPVLGGIVLVFVLVGQLSASFVICFPLPTPLKLHLEAAEVGTCLLYLVVTHPAQPL